MNTEAASPPSWRQGLESLKSLGSQDAGPGSLAGLHEARKRHLSQYFTPLAVVRVAWQAAMQAAASLKGRRTVSLLDNSVGTGRMLHYATRNEFTIAGLDVHEDVVRAVQEAAEAAKFSVEVVCVGMQDANPTGFDVALINPPFSIHLESPSLKPYPCTTWGRFGANTSAQSDDYALSQALDAASVVAAVVPNSLADAVMSGGVVGPAAARLRAVVRLGRDAFAEEGADVQTSLLIFGDSAGSFVGEFKPASLDDFVLPSLGLRLSEYGQRGRLRVVGLSDEEPVVTLPVTGENTVRVSHSGRKIHLSFACGLVQAKVLNAVYRERVFSNDVLKLAKGVKYAGQGLLDVQNMLACERPLEQLDRLGKIINEAGGKVVVDPGLTGYLRNLVRRKPRQTEPFGHWVYSRRNADAVSAKAARSVPLEPKSWTSPVIRAGEEAKINRTKDGWSVSKGGKTLVMTEQEARTLFNMPVEEAGWVQVHKPLQTKFPAIAHELEVRARKLGIHHWLNWKFQFDDLIEVTLRPSGGVVGWMQGLGKARLIAALILLRGIKHGLIVMPAYLLSEYEHRLVDAGLDPSMWQVISSPEQIDNLRRINVISFERLRMPVRSKVAEADIPEEDDGDGVAVSEAESATTEDGPETGPAIKKKRDRLTYAKKLRRRCAMVVCDEGEVLANPGSQRSVAVAQLAAKVCIVSSGTPMGNYPRDLLPIAAQTVGDGVVGNEYGIMQPMLDARNALSMQYTVSGIEEFRDRFVSVVWVTRQFQETLVEGAKREVPAIKDVNGYRQWAGGFVKRRVHREPEVEACVKIADPIRESLLVEFDDAHLSYYLTVADEFAEWYKRTDPTKRASNLMLLLARISAVEAACNVPQRSKKTGPAWRGGLTSKQRAVAAKAVELAKSGHKTVIFAESPTLLRTLQREIDKAGVEAVQFHGEITRKKRQLALDERFRYGPAGVLLATKGCTQAGLDLYQADSAILADRSWSARDEDQAIRRLLRPQQQRDVTVYAGEIAGSLDVYMGQMVRWKSVAAESGLDWGDPMPADVEFEHLDTILGRFVENLAALRGMKGSELREQLRIAA